MRRNARLALAATVLAGCGVAAGLFAAERAGVMPRTLAPYIEKRSSGHNAVIVGAGQFASRSLLALDRGASGGVAAPDLAPDLAALTLGAQPQAAGAPGLDAGLVRDVAGLRAAMAAATPGTTITLAPGSYPIEHRALEASRPGSAQAPVVVRAAQPGTVTLRSNVPVAIRVNTPHWRFENLTIDGACAAHDDCEHAFQVTGAASHFAAVNNTLQGFNAHFKINGAGGRFPDQGLIEANTLSNPAPRATRKPVTPIDLVAASDWTVRGNIIRDFIKAGGDGISYGAFAKGGGSGNLFERNLVWCEAALAGQPGQRVGLSLGGGGTGKPYCRDGRCIMEQERSVLRANLIVGCSDVGIYLNSAADTRIEDNTLVDTAGIDVRFATSSAHIDGNLVDGPIRSRDGGLLHLGDNRDAALWRSYAGLHPVRSLFAAPAGADFLWHGEAPARSTPRQDGVDLCGAARSQAKAYGAFEDFGACRRR
ncbi:right-handed parallel beta-helix repeat-containing protein [Massilia sp. CFBP9012]|uniref:right-handed parallel beta-helix repeat-containing protein n=1 Tax=Massilia sp. CFBP9012 TaxID=3096531 RepID=UPI002A6A9FEB|nr:right-handed parallel beta-helix repeat-containing protein [Massilia sp. CFBP9012]MDY0974389.1 right-handed parallel beta-helix repeat-containing protein [Massilia sp. CFBP9012]